MIPPRVTSAAKVPPGQATEPHRLLRPNCCSAGSTPASPPELCSASPTERFLAESTPQGPLHQRHSPRRVDSAAGTQHGKCSLHHKPSSTGSSRQPRATPCQLSLTPFLGPSSESSQPLPEEHPFPPTSHHPVLWSQARVSAQLPCSEAVGHWLPVIHVLVTGVFH